MAKNKFNPQWMQTHLNDPYVKLAQKEGYRARAAYKLKEIDENEKLIQRGQVIVDLGCAPGSWSQYVRNKLSGKDGGGIHGMIIGIDLLPMEPIADVHFIQEDFRGEKGLLLLEEILAGRKVDLVISDMAPNLSGIADVDAAKMEDLIDLSLDFCQQHLKPSGVFLAKCFNGKGYGQLVQKFRDNFEKVNSQKPKASRDKSSEIYLLGKKIKYL